VDCNFGCFFSVFLPYVGSVLSARMILWDCVSSAMPACILCSVAHSAAACSHSGELCLLMFYIVITRATIFMLIPDEVIGFFQLT
jgi:hypothetical protein